MGVGRISAASMEDLSFWNLLLLLLFIKDILSVVQVDLVEQFLLL